MARFGTKYQNICRMKNCNISNIFYNRDIRKCTESMIFCILIFYNQSHPICHILFNENGKKKVQTAATRENAYNALSYQCPVSRRN